MSADHQGDVFHVTSHNQSGGITAGQVFVGQQGRHVTDAVKSQLTQLIAEHEVEKVIVTAGLGNAEAIQFAAEIKAYLLSIDMKVDGIKQAVWSGPVVGQEANLVPGTKNLELTIGSQPVQ